MVEAARFVAGEPRRVIAPDAPLRRTPRGDAGLETEALMGDAVTVYEVRDGFAWVQLARDGYVGYLPEASLGPADPEPTHRVTALRTFLYPAPDMKRPALGHLGLGARIAVAAVDGDYLRAGAAYVFAAHCAPLDRTVPDYAGTAERLVGTPYLWGGRTSLGLDCSGLVQLCLDLAGLACPRDADQQARAVGRALPLAFDGLRRGDFIDWRGHTGLMLDADTPDPRQRPPHGGGGRAPATGGGADRRRQLRRGDRDAAAGGVGRGTRASSLPPLRGRVTLRSRGERGATHPASSLPSPDPR